MATCRGIVNRFQRIVIWREVMLCHDSRVFNSSSPALGQCRSVHSSSGLSTKSLLYKFTSKTKKKKWYNSTWQVPVECKPPALVALIKQQKAEKAENNPRIKALNGILYQSITSLLNTPEVSEEVFDLCIQLSKVSVSRDLSVCRAYWLSSSNKNTDDKIDNVLQKYASRFRHLMISYHVLGNVPQVVFLRDKEDHRRQQIEELLASIRSEEHTGSLVKTDESRKLDTESPKEDAVFQVPCISSIDHAELNQQILAYKKKMKDIVVETDGSELSRQQQEQLAEIRKQKLQRKKMKKQKRSADDISPKDYLLLNAMDSDIKEELDLEIHEDLVELDETEEPNDGST